MICPELIGRSAGLGSILKLAITLNYHLKMNSIQSTGSLVRSPIEGDSQLIVRLGERLEGQSVLIAAFAELQIRLRKGIRQLQRARNCR